LNNKITFHQIEWCLGPLITVICDSSVAFLRALLSLQGLLDLPFHTELLPGESVFSWRSRALKVRPCARSARALASKQRVEARVRPINRERHPWFASSVWVGRVSARFPLTL